MQIMSAIAARHLFQRVAEHKYSAIDNRHFHEAHGRRDKFDCLVFEMLYIKKFKPNLNVQTDSTRAKLFV